ncbi:transglutaminase-like domain-containing protein [Ferruginibacter lapsinanis]|uniref:transglutaminase-like domain-containing protein n=1 Tax=Ferruginibacter lapsinanis TaxID=563172 RepID=UPI001E6552AA|nr:transglutaminase-like domain-containing protein [Ferruginibacter lapsinanis]UEG49284.1 transglutaminase-like domain-containing protein [Ferruginibacter lapsinanis]
MIENKEISALFHLIDDPDEEVYSTVSDKLISFGKDIIPNLEDLWENTTNEEIQERIESLIHKLHFRDLTEDFIHWKNNDGSLLQGAILIARYHYPEMQTTQVLQEIEKLRRNIWLELNRYLTPLEQITVFTSILYNYYKQQGVEIAYEHPEDFLINKTLETKKGNAISNGIIYLILCEILDIPVKAINLPRQFILAHFDPQFEMIESVAHNSEKILFYIDPLNGQIYSHKDVENYFKRISVPPTNSYFKPMDNKRVIQFLLEELSKCFDDDRNRYKMQELLSLVTLLDE